MTKTLKLKKFWLFFSLFCIMTVSVAIFCGCRFSLSQSNTEVSPTEKYFTVSVYDGKTLIYKKDVKATLEEDESKETSDTETSKAGEVKSNSSQQKTSKWVAEFDFSSIELPKTYLAEKIFNSDNNTIDNNNEKTIRTKNFSTYDKVYNGFYSDKDLKNQVNGPYTLTENTSFFIKVEELYHITFQSTTGQETTVSAKNGEYVKNTVFTESKSGYTFSSWGLSEKNIFSQDYQMVEVDNSRFIGKNVTLQPFFTLNATDAS